MMYRLALGSLGFLETLKLFHLCSQLCSQLVNLLQFIVQVESNKYDFEKILLCGRGVGYRNRDR